MIPTEAQEQAALVEYLELKGLKFTAIPNSTYTKSWKQKRKNTNQGLRPGFPDLVVVIPDKYLLCIEMKRKKKSRVSKHQEKWIEALNTIPLIKARVCYGADEAIDFVKKYNTRKPNEVEIFMAYASTLE